MDVTSTTSGPIVFPWQLMFRMVMLIKVTWQLEQLCLHLVIPCSQIPQKKRPAAEIISVNGDCCCIIATQSSNIFMEHLGCFSQKWPWTLMPTVTLVYYDETDRLRLRDILPRNRLNQMNAISRSAILWFNFVDKATTNFAEMLINWNDDQFLLDGCCGCRDENNSSKWHKDRYNLNCFRDCKLRRWIGNYKSIRQRPRADTARTFCVQEHWKLFFSKRKFPSEEN